MTTNSVTIARVTPTPTSSLRGPASWSTAQVTPAEQYAYWRHALTQTYTPLLPVGLGSGADQWVGNGELRGSIQERTLGDIRVSRIESIRQTHRHGRRELARTDDEVVFVNLQVAGRCKGRQGNRVCVSQPGTFAVFDATQEFQLEYLDDWAAISLRIPRESLLMFTPSLERVTSVAVGGGRGLGAVVADLMGTLWRVGGDIADTPHGSDSIGQIFLPALAAALRDEGTGSPADRFQDDAAIRSAVLRHVRRHLKGGDLSPPAVASTFGISVRKLHQLFESTASTFRQTVTQLRVEACSADIRRGDPGRTLTRIAAAWGFADLSHMNRVFRATVNRMPSSYRDGP